jgi:hypothetical protein
MNARSTCRDKGWFSQCPVRPLWPALVDRFSDKIVLDQEASACPGKMDTGFPERTCANARKLERIPVQLNRDTL